MALRTPTKGSPSITYNKNIRESQRVKGLRSKLSPKEKMSERKVAPEEDGHLSTVELNAETCTVINLGTLGGTPNRDP